MRGRATPSPGFERGAWAILSFALGGLGLAACGGGGDQTSSEIWCDGLCAAVQRCGYRDEGCHSDCVRDRPGLANISTNGAAAEEPCLEQLSCTALSGDDAAWSSELHACWETAEHSLSASAHAHHFCAGHALAWFDCGYTLSLHDCEGMYGMWKDSVLDRVAACEAKPSCDDFQACEDAVFEDL